MLWYLLYTSYYNIKHLVLDPFGPAAVTSLSIPIVVCLAVSTFVIHVVPFETGPSAVVTRSICPLLRHSFNSGKESDGRH